MSKSVLELAVETGQWTGGLKKAQNALQNFTQASGSTSEAISKSGDKMAQFVSRMGNMESKAKTATGRLKEMENVYKELAVQYKQLTDQERQTPYGKALNQSLSQLQTRIKSARVDIQSVNAELGTGSNGMGNAMQQLASKMGLPIASLSKLSVGLAAAGTALKVAGDAMKQNEVVMDEWGRVQESSKAMYDGFLNAINTGNISGYLTNMDNIVAAARAAYNAMDELGTFNAFNQINTEKARTGLTEALAGYRTGEFSKEQVQSAADEMKKQLDDRQKLEQEAYDEAINKLAATRNVNAEELKKALSGDWGDYKDLMKLPMSGREGKFSPGGMFGGSMYYEEEVAANEMESLGEMLRHFSDTELQSLQAIGAQAQRTANEIAQVDKQTARVFGQKKVEDAAGRVAKATTPAARRLTMDEDIQLINDQIMSQFDPKPIVEQIRDKFGEYTVTVPVKVEVDEEVADAEVQQLTQDVKGMTSAWSAASSAVGSVGSALSGLEDPSAKVAGIVAAAIAQVAAGLGSMLAQPAATSEAWGWIALAATGAATMVGTIAAIKSATEYHADGGFAGMMQPRGTDVVPAMLTPGELVLNRAQQRNLAGQLTGTASMGDMTLRTEISGENLAIVLDNNNRRRGRSARVR